MQFLVYVGGPGVIVSTHLMQCLAKDDPRVEQTCEISIMMTIDSPTLHCTNISLGGGGGNIGSRRNEQIETEF